MSYVTKDVSPEVMNSPVTKGELSTFIGLFRLQGLYVDNALLAAYRDDKVVLLDYLAKLSVNSDRIDQAHDRMLGRPVSSNSDEA